MMLPTLRPWILCTLLALLIPGWIVATAGQQVDRAESAAERTSKPEKLRGRLPAYFGKVVDDSQRQEIYQIQADYKDRIAKLQAALASMVKQRDREILTVLSADQLEELKALQKAARDRSKRAKRVSSTGGNKSAETGRSNKR